MKNHAVYATILLFGSVACQKEVTPDDFSPAPQDEPEHYLQKNGEFVPWNPEQQIYRTETPRSTDQELLVLPPEPIPYQSPDVDPPKTSNCVKLAEWVMPFVSVLDCKNMAKVRTKLKRSKCRRQWAELKDSFADCECTPFEITLTPPNKPTRGVYIQMRDRFVDGSMCMDVTVHLSKYPADIGVYVTPGYTVELPPGVNFQEPEQFRNRFKGPLKDRVLGMDVFNLRYNGPRVQALQINNWRVMAERRGRERVEIKVGVFHILQGL